MNEQATLFDDNPEYQAFVDKFKPKKTTDDCYTPPEIYEVVKNWACKEYGIDPAKIVRPFYPGGDYERYSYPYGAVVLDNPPFSILSKICKFYLDRGISFFLFAPSLTAFSGSKIFHRMNHIICDANITYENGAVVRTAFVTSYGRDIVAQTAPELGWMINETSARLRKEKTRELPKYEYPDHIITAARMQYYAKHGVDFKVRSGDCVLISAMDRQRAVGKRIFGRGLLLSDKVAERKKTQSVQRQSVQRRMCGNCLKGKRKLSKKWGNNNKLLLPAVSVPPEDPSVGNLQKCRLLTLFYMPTTAHEPKRAPFSPWCRGL